MRRNTLAKLGILTSIFVIGCSSNPPPSGTDDDDDDDDASSDSDDDDDDDDSGDTGDDSDGSNDSGDDDDDDDDSSGDDDDDDSSGDDDDDSGDDDDDNTGDDDDDDTPDEDCLDNVEDADASDLDFANNLLPSPAPPGGLALKDTPMFVVFGWDDVENAPGMTFVNELLGGVTNPNGKKAGTNLNPNPCYGVGWGGGAGTPCGDGTMSQDKSLITQHSFDIGNHTYDHLESNSTWPDIPADWKDTEMGGWKYDENGMGPGIRMDLGLWKTILMAADAGLKSVYPGLTPTGFRAPRLEVNDNGLKAVKEMGYQYDENLEEYLPENMVDAAVSRDGSKGEGFNWVYWPYTLDNGSPGIWNQQAGGDKKWVVDYPKGLWEIPVYMLYLSEASGLGKTVAENMLAADKNCEFPADWPADQKDHCYLSADEAEELEGGATIKQVTSFDFNTFIYSRFTKEIWVEAMKNTFLLRYHGNRAPLTFGTHPTQYTESYDNATLSQANNFGFKNVLDYNKFPDRKAALQEFIKWAQDNYGDETYFVSAKQLADFMAAPYDIKGDAAPKDEVAEPASNGLFNRLGWKGEDATIKVIDGNSADISFKVSEMWTPVPLAAGILAGSFEGVSHIDIEYETDVPFRVRLYSDDKPSVSVLLAGVGGTRTARIRAKDFVVENWSTPEEIANMPLVDASYMKSVSGMAFESATNGVTGTGDFTLKIKQITLHGVATKDLCSN
jgi:hypothetical protein